ncbi:MAG: nnr [Gammaproteobacteria bacterium]|jgi:NAD(P)H-hydrate epimerase|nr:nnr [Gammaproteobacteria bacterium]
MTIETLQFMQFTSCLAPRPYDSHKNTFGYVLIVGGDYGFSGAVRLAAEAALRVGAGLVSVATRPEYALHLNGARPEIMCHGICHTKDLMPLLAKATVVVCGSGLGQSSWAKKMLGYVLKSKKLLIMDADALNLLAKKPIYYENWVLTPHPGEAARLLNTTSTVIQHDRLAAVIALQRKYGGISVLKGAGTLIADIEGIPALCKLGNPGMATAGMGDVLSGVIGGLAAQGMSLTMAAKLGVLVHAEAGDLAAKKGQRGMIASDLFQFFRQLINVNCLTDS